MVLLAFCWLFGCAFGVFQGCGKLGNNWIVRPIQFIQVQSFRCESADTFYHVGRSLGCEATANGVRYSSHATESCPFRTSEARTFDGCRQLFQNATPELLPSQLSMVPRSRRLSGSRSTQMWFGVSRVCRKTRNSHSLKKPPFFFKWSENIDVFDWILLLSSVKLKRNSIPRRTRASPQHISWSGKLQII